MLNEDLAIILPLAMEQQIKEVRHISNIVKMDARVDLLDRSIWRNERKLFATINRHGSFPASFISVRLLRA